jgi:hypothetical protein
LKGAQSIEPINCVRLAHFVENFATLNHQQSVAGLLAAVAGFQSGPPRASLARPGARSPILGEMPVVSKSMMAMGVMGKNTGVWIKASVSHAISEIN